MCAYRSMRIEYMIHRVDEWCESVRLPRVLSMCMRVWACGLIVCALFFYLRLVHEEMLSRGDCTTTCMERIESMAREIKHRQTAGIGVAHVVQHEVAGVYRLMFYSRRGRALGSVCEALEGRELVGFEQ